MKKVYILTYNNMGFDGVRSIFGVYASEDLAMDSMNDDLLQPLEESFSDYEELWNTLDPEIEEWEISE